MFLFIFRSRIKKSKKERKKERKKPTADSMKFKVK